MMMNMAEALMPTVTVPPAASRRMTLPWKARLTKTAPITRTILIQNTGLISSRIGSPMIRPIPERSITSNAHQIHFT